MKKHHLLAALASLDGNSSLIIGAFILLDLAMMMARRHGIIDPLIREVMRLRDENGDPGELGDPA